MGGGAGARRCSVRQFNDALNGVPRAVLLVVDGAFAFLGVAPKLTAPEAATLNCRPRACLLLRLLENDC